MNVRMKTMVLALSIASLLASPLANAARMGKGGSYGKRSAPTQSYKQRAMPAPAPVPAPAQAPQGSKGMGMGTVVAAGAAGAAAGYLLGSANSDKQATQQHAQASQPAAQPAPVQQASKEPARSGTPWGLIMLLALVFCGGLIWFRRRMATPGNAPQAMQPNAPQMPAGGDNRFSPIPSIGSGNNAAGGFGNTAPVSDNRRLPDGTEAPYFLRQVKATFLHLQSLNTPEGLEEVRRYMTPELFAEISASISSNSAVADFSNLDCQLLDSGEENGRFVASVRFSGQVSEEVNAPAVPFAETWNFIREQGVSGKWLVAGIQQD